jgi:KaiC/GvpD/RAD55 family RecA-like ATPase
LEQLASENAQLKRQLAEYRKHDLGQFVFGKEAPQALDMEESVLGAMLMDSSAVAIVTEMLQVDSFYTDAHKAIFHAILELTKNNRPVDLLTVTHEMIRLKTIDTLESGPYYLTELSSRVGSAANVEYHARIVLQKSLSRKFVNICTEGIRQGYNESKDVFESYDWLNQATRVNNPRRILRVMSMNEAIVKGAKEPERMQIIGNLIREGDITILFGDEGTGKSIFAFQMAIAASTGKPLYGNADEFQNAAGPMKTLIFDFELECRELFDRYSESGLAYSFSDNLLRSDINPDCLDLENGDNKLMKAVQLQIEQTQPKFVVVDNITWLSSESQDTKIASDFMKQLTALQRKMGLTVVVVAHTPKRNTSEPIESKHLAGSSNLKNFAKNIIAVSPSKRDPNIRYVKHVKCRNAFKIHGADNVIQCQIERDPNSALLEFKFMCTNPEAVHLATVENDMSDEDICQAALKLRDEKMSWEEILLQLDLSWSRRTIVRKVEDFKKSGKWLDGL